MDQTFTFCPKCGELINTTASTKAQNTTKPSSSIKFSLPSFASFKTKKESDRQSSFHHRSNSKKRKIQEKEVTIQVGVMDDDDMTIKRGETIPLKITSTATAQAILEAAVKKHAAFNKRFDHEREHSLVFKDGSKVTVIPGIDPEESFTLKRYKEESGFGYSRIAFYLFPVLVRNVVDELRATLAELADDEISVSSGDDNSDELPPVNWMKNGSSTEQSTCSTHTCTKGGQATSK
ncbi:MAG: hypothetical protein DSY43_04625 [Gammaproteobacteria bacterium]|nr:MAG: hypothetical protein DSY43_04625 [Gammaproteobacteria bacterium]